MGSDSHLSGEYDGFHKRGSLAVGTEGLSVGRHEALPPASPCAAVSAVHAQVLQILLWRVLHLIAVTMSSSLIA